MLCEAKTKVIKNDSLPNWEEDLSLSVTAGMLAALVTPPLPANGDTAKGGLAHAHFELLLIDAAAGFSQKKTLGYLGPLSIDDASFANGPVLSEQARASGPRDPRRASSVISRRPSVADMPRVSWGGGGALLPRAASRVERRADRDSRRERASVASMIVRPRATHRTTASVACF